MKDITTVESSEKTEIFLVCPKIDPDATKAYIRALPGVKLRALPAGCIHMELPAEVFTAHKDALNSMARLYKGEKLS